MPLKPAEEMRPAEIIQARDRSALALVPVSPLFEWHSYHLPLGVDGLICESICALAAEALGGIYFRALSFGLDSTRTPQESAMWGLPARPAVFGMRFPAVPVTSEYAQAREMLQTVRNRLFALRATGFRRAILVNHHCGAGQVDALAELAEQESRPGFTVQAVMPMQFITLQADELRAGGHAGLSETILLMAFRPDLVDLTQLPEGELSVAEMGILHDRPIIDAQWNPRHASLVMANEVRRQMLQGLIEFASRQ